MRVLQVTAYYPPSIGGIQYYVQSLSRSLARQGHDVDVLTINTDQSQAHETTSEGVNVRRCDCDLSLYRAVMSQEFNQALMNARDYDAYHVHIPFHVGLEVTAAAAKRNGVALVATHHGQGLKGSPLYTLLATTYSWLSRAFSLQAVDRMIFLTKSYAQSLWLPSRIRNRMRIVHTGAEIDGFSPDRDGLQVRRQYGVQPTTPLLLFVGSLHQANRYKGVDYLIRALRLVNEVVKEAKLMVVGGGALLPELQALAHQLDLQERIIFTGPIDNARLPNYYAAADLLALPSIRGPENSPVVVFEAMASAKPVVASDLPGVREIVRHEENGLLVAPRDVAQLASGITRVLSDQGLRQRLSQQARHLAESYSWEHCAHEMENVYREVITS